MAMEPEKLPPVQLPGSPAPITKEEAEQMLMLLAKATGVWLEVYTNKPPTQAFWRRQIFKTLAPLVAEDESRKEDLAQLRILTMT